MCAAALDLRQGFGGGQTAGVRQYDRGSIQYDPRYNNDAAAKRTSERKRMLPIKHREEREEGCAVKESVIPQTRAEQANTEGYESAPLCDWTVSAERKNRYG